MTGWIVAKTSSSGMRGIWTRLRLASTQLSASAQARVLDGLGYVTVMRWRLYGEEAVAGKEADLWLLEKTLTVEHAGEPLSSYEVGYDPDGGQGGAGRLLRVERPTLFETPFASNQMRLFGLAETLGDDGWLKALRLEDYAPRSPRRPLMLQQVLFAYADAI